MVERSAMIEEIKTESIQAFLASMLVTPVSIDAMTIERAFNCIPAQEWSRTA
jgi:hypothetical protein